MEFFASNGDSPAQPDRARRRELSASPAILRSSRNHLCNRNGSRSSSPHHRSAEHEWPIIDSYRTGYLDRRQCDWIRERDDRRLAADSRSLTRLSARRSRSRAHVSSRRSQVARSRSRNFHSISDCGSYRARCRSDSCDRARVHRLTRCHLPSRGSKGTIGASIGDLAWRMPICAESRPSATAWR